MNLNIVANTLKHSTIGITAGVGAGAVAEYIGDELCHLLSLKRSGEATELMGELFVRAAVAGVVLVAGKFLIDGVNVNFDDPTGGAMFAYGFSAAQPNFYSAAVQLPNAVMHAVNGSAKPCCSDCANGASCAGNK